MSAKELEPYKLFVLQLATYFGQALSAEQVELYARVLAQAPMVDLERAGVMLMNDAGVTRMPLPGQILGRIRPEQSDEMLARDAAARILSAVRRYGYTNERRAREYVGELGWAVVELQGGWRSVCETLTASNQPTSQAQWRELALATARRARAGTLGLAPALPSAVTAALPAKFLKEVPR